MAARLVPQQIIRGYLVHGRALDGPVVANCSGVTAEALSVSCPLEIRRAGGAGAINRTATTSSWWRWMTECRR
eukprot:COSAG01_NODE_20350_length_956_cov_1.714785_2_plen_73_part_00